MLRKKFSAATQCFYWNNHIATATVKEPATTSAPVKGRAPLKADNTRLELASTVVVTPANKQQVDATEQSAANPTKMESGSKMTADNRAPENPVADNSQNETKLSPNVSQEYPIETNLIDSDNNTIAPLDIDGVPASESNTLSMETSKNVIPSHPSNKTDDTPEDMIKRGPFSLSLEGGLCAVQKLLTSNQQSLENHIDRRKAEEQSILSLSAGMKLNYQAGNWIISSGISYNEMGEKTNYTPNVREQENISDNSFWSIATFTYWSTDSTGSPIVVVLRDSNYNEVLTVDTTTVTDNSIIEQNSKTKLIFLEIPVLIGYEFPLKNLSIIARTGVSLGYLISSKGYYLNRNNEQLLNINTSEGLLSSFAFNYILRIGVHYQWNKSITAFAEPSFKTNLHSVLKKQYDVSQKYYMYGINLGIKYQL